MDAEAIKKSVHWVMGRNDLFINSVGDIQLLPIVLEAAVCFESAPSDMEMDNLVRRFHLEPLFTF